VTDQSIRSYLATLEANDELVRFERPVDPKSNLTAIGWKTYDRLGKASLFTNLVGYQGWTVANQIITDRRKWALALGVGEDDVVKTFNDRVRTPLPTFEVGRDAAPVKQIIEIGGDADLTRIPAAWTSQDDPGPYFASGMAIIKDPETGVRNMSIHRQQVLGPDRTGYLICPRQALRIYQKYQALGRPMPVAITIGAHPAVYFASSYTAAYGTDELTVAGALMGDPVRMVACETVDLEVPADAEIVLEGEILPIGWTADEGPFGEFSQISGDVKWNPIFRVRCITRRRKPIFYMLQMPWENNWLSAPVTEAAGLQALRVASVEPVAIRAPVGSCGYWTLIASIRKRPGEGKNALLALLSVAEVKLAIVTDDDIDINDPDDIDWALTFRVQADQDLITVSGARGKHVDPSIRAWELGQGGLPLTAKLGIDATIPEGIPRWLYKRIEPFGKDRVKLEDYL